MAQTYQARFVDEGVSIEHTPGGSVAAGAVVEQGTLIGVAKTPIAASALGALSLSGTYNVVKVTGALSAGDTVFWDDVGNPAGGVGGTGALTASSGGNIFFGFCVLDAAGAAEYVRVYLFPPVTVSVTSYNATDNPIVDPGDGLAIPVTVSGSCQLVSLGAETRTLADPTIVGQIISLSLKTDGGDVVVTVASPFNQHGDTVFTLDDLGDVVTLIAVADDADLEWRVLGADGTTADQNGVENVIVDPGSGGAIPVIRSGSVALVSGGAEARSLADPTFIGQLLNIGVHTYGGVITITANADINQNGDNIITFDNVGDHILLIGSPDGADIEWRVVVNDGGTLS